MDEARVAVRDEPGLGVERDLALGIGERLLERDRPGQSGQIDARPVQLGARDPRQLEQSSMSWDMRWAALRTRPR